MRMHAAVHCLAGLGRTGTLIGTQFACFTGTKVQILTHGGADRYVYDETPRLLSGRVHRLAPDSTPRYSLYLLYLVQKYTYSATSTSASQRTSAYAAYADEGMAYSAYAMPRYTLYLLYLVQF